MLRDPELAALLDQARRNMDTLQLLARHAQEQEDDLTDLQELRDRIAALKAAYTHETDALTRQVLRREVERRVTRDRRRPYELQRT
jgi:hypothetical protein